MTSISEKDWKSALTSIIEELDQQQYKKMLEKLTEIPKGQRNGRSKEKMPQKIIEHYGLEGSIDIIREIMDQIPRKDPKVQGLLRPFVDKMKNKNGKPNVGKKRKRDPEEKKKSLAADQQKRSRPDQEGNTSSSKKSISDLKSSREPIDPFHFIAGKVVQKSDLRTYQTKEKEKKFFFYVAVADATASIKMMVYGQKYHKQIEEEKSYLFEKLLRDDRCVKVTAQSKVSETSSVKVPKKLEMEARTLIYPVSPVLSIAEVKSPAERTEVSVEGTVKKIDPVEKVPVRDKQQKTKQNFHLRDDTDSIEICMWGEKTGQSKTLSVGDVIKVTNLKTNLYCGTISLNSTGSTQIHKVQSVGIQNVKMQIIGIIKTTKKETHLEAEFNQQVHTFVVGSQLLAKALGLTLDGDFKESLLEKMPLSADAVIKGNRLKKITAA